MSADDEYAVPNSFEQFRSEFGVARRRICDVEWQQSRHESAAWDGGHCSPRGRSRPISISAGEALLLAFAVNALNARAILEIGTGFGYSTAWLAFGAHLTGGHVVSIDDHSEGSMGSEGARAAADFVAESGVSQFVSLFDGHSPDDLPRALGDVVLDFVFVDGNHNDDQPKRDYQAITGQLADSGVIVFHDAFWWGPERRNSVYRAVEMALADGFEMLAIETSCQPVAVSRSTESLRRVRRTLDAARLMTEAGKGLV